MQNQIIVRTEDGRKNFYKVSEATDVNGNAVSIAKFSFTTDVATLNADITKLQERRDLEVAKKQDEIASIQAKCAEQVAKKQSYLALLS